MRAVALRVELVSRQVPDQVQYQKTCPKKVEVFFDFVFFFEDRKADGSGVVCAKPLYACSGGLLTVTISAG